MVFRSEFRVITRLTRLFENGASSKQAVDEAIDMCSSLFTNLREAIKEKQQLASNELRSSGVLALSVTPESVSSINHAVNYLTRYFYLVAFSEYLSEQRDAPRRQSGALRKTFSQWWKNRPELAELAASIPTDII
jgi:hypothetical protein